MNIGQINYLPALFVRVLPVMATGVAALFVCMLPVMATGVAALFVCLLPIMATGVRHQTPTSESQLAL